MINAAKRRRSSASLIVDAVVLYAGDNVLSLAGMRIKVAVEAVVGWFYAHYDAAHNYYMGGEMLLPVCDADAGRRSAGAITVLVWGACGRPHRRCLALLLASLDGFGSLRVRRVREHRRRRFLVELAQLLAEDSVSRIPPPVSLARCAFLDRPMLAAELEPAEFSESIPRFINRNRPWANPWRLTLWAG